MTTSPTILEVRAMIADGTLTCDTSWRQDHDATGIQWVSDDRQSDMDAGDLVPGQSVMESMVTAWVEFLSQGHDGTGRMCMR